MYAAMYVYTIQYNTIQYTSTYIHTYIHTYIYDGDVSVRFDGDRRDDGFGFGMPAGRVMEKGGLVDFLRRWSRLRWLFFSFASGGVGGKTPPVGGARDVDLCRLANLRRIGRDLAQAIRMFFPYRGGRRVMRTCNEESINTL